MSARRLTILYSVLLLAFSVVVCRLYLIAGNEAYAQRVQTQSTVTLALPARRGGFYDCEGRLLTGLSQEYYALCLPGEGSYARLYDYASGADQAVLYRRRNAAAPFLLRVSQDLTSLDVYTVSCPRRYCAVPLCQHLIGYLDGEGRGVAGLEAALEEQLAGSGAQDAIQCTVNAQGRLLSGTEPVYLLADSGAVGVRLTISRPVQRGVEAVAAETMTTGCILVLDVSTAKVRACVSLPGYDPENVSASLDAADSPLVNRALSAYAVGSVFKPVLAAAALESGQDSLEIDCAGAVVVDGQIYRCAGGVAHGETDLAGALRKSCNGYFIRLGQTLGVQAVRQMAADFGFGQAVELAGSLKAAAGNLPAEDTLANSGQFANFSFGQGELTATPVQVAGMMNAIAADGIYRTPSFLECTLDETTGEELEVLSHPVRRRVISTRTAAALQQMLCGVVADGTGREAAPAHGEAGGKTGTAQTGRYNADGEEYKDLWFAGFWPAEDPQYTVVVLQDNQLSPEHSSAAIFAQVCETLYLLEKE